MRRTVSTVLGLALLTIAAAAQTPAKPDFSGTWAFDQAATLENARVAQMQGGPIFGDAFIAAQTAAALTLNISAGTLRVTAVYALDGSASKNASPASAPGAATIEVTSRARWDADHLVITSNSQSPGPAGPVTVESTRTMWLDANGRLVIERTGTPREMVPASRSVYSKQ